MIDISCALQIDGWMTEDELTWLAEQAQNVPIGGTIVEIGTYLGRSARAILDNANNKRHDHDGYTKLYCVDPYTNYEDPVIKMDGDEGTRIFMQACVFNLRDYMTSRRVEFIRKSSVFSANDFDNESIDMVFIDGDHAYRSVLDDITVWERKVKPGGLICGHDYHVYSSVKLAVDDCFGYSRVEFPAGSIWAVRKPE